MSVSLSSLGEAASVSDGSGAHSWQGNVPRSVTDRGHIQMLIVYPAKTTGPEN